MDKRWLVLFAFLLLLMQSAGAAVNIFYEADLKIELNKQTFSPGETLEALIEIANFEQFPIIEGLLIVEVISGKEIAYPTQFSDEGTIFYEEVIENVNIAGRQKRNIAFTYALPDDLKEGDYALNVYFKTKITPITGAPSIMMNPKSGSFSVTSSTGEFPQLNILRTKTAFNNTLGPVGTFVEAGEEINGKVFIENVSGERLSTLELFVGLCEWDDTSCGSFEQEKTVSIDSINSGQTKEVEVFLNAPAMPGAYAIRIEAREKDGRMISLYRNRAIVEGATAKIRKLIIGQLSFGAEDEILLNLLIGPSPDHKNYPDFENFELVVSVEDLDGPTTLTDSKAIPIIRAKIPEYLEEQFSFSVPTRLDNFKVCGKIVKESIVYDEHCYTVRESEFFVVTEPEYSLVVEWTYNALAKKLDIKFCGKIDGEATGVNGNYYILDRSINEIIEEDSFSSDGCITKKASIEPGEYLLIVNDLINNEQKNFELKLEEEGPVVELKNCSELGGVICRENEMCPGSFISASDSRRCCSAECVVLQPKPEFDLLGAFLILVLLVVLIVIIVFGTGYIKRRTKKNE